MYDRQVYGLRPARLTVQNYTITAAGAGCSDATIHSLINGRLAFCQTRLGGDLQNTEMGSDTQVGAVAGTVPRKAAVSNGL